MSTYVQFTREQIETALPIGWGVADEQFGTEIVYCWTGPMGLSDDWLIKCYSGLQEGEDLSREAGKDAIRFALIDKVSDKGYGKAIRVHRVGTIKTLRARMVERFDELVALATENSERCKKCGAATVERTNRSNGNKFRGCIQWQDCRIASIKLTRQAENDSVDEGDEMEREVEKLLDTPENGDTPTGKKVLPFNRVPLPDIIRVPDREYEDSELEPTKGFPELAFAWPRFNPIQSAFVPFIKKDVNIVVAASTSAGKTVLAELVISDVLKKGLKGIFLSPLKAVTEEKHREWTSRAFKDKKVSIVTGDFVLTDKRKKELAEADVILMTSEMLDSRTRRMQQEKNEWLYKVGVCVVDEAHLLKMESRGDRLESGLMRFTKQNPSCRIALLSATMPNIDDLARWLSGMNGKPTQVLHSDWRPVRCDVKYVPHLSRARYAAVEADKVRLACEEIDEHSKDKFLCFVHTKATGRMLMSSLKFAGVRAEFHSADLNRDDRLRIEAEFAKK